MTLLFLPSLRTFSSLILSLVWMVQCLAVRYCSKGASRPLPFDVVLFVEDLRPFFTVYFSASRPSTNRLETTQDSLLQAELVMGGEEEELSDASYDFWEPRTSSVWFG